MTHGLSSAPALTAPLVQRLPNGLTIIVEQTPIEAVNLSLWLGVGSAIEPDPINGMAHFLEHMIFKGTSRLESGEFERAIEQRGAVTNAATSQDYTYYYITTAPQDFAELAPLQIEVVLNAAIPDDAFERERSVILEEIRRSNDSPRRRVFQRSMELAFDQLPYRRPVLGTEAVIESLKAQQMRDFHSTWYRPQSMTAVAVGNLPVEQLIEIVASGFSNAYAHHASPIYDTATEALAMAPSLSVEPGFPAIARQSFVDPSLQQARLVMVWRVPGMNDLMQTYALDMLTWVLAQRRTARLVRELREEQQLVSSISVSNMTYTAQGLFYISAQLPSENLEQVEGAIAHHIHRLQTELIPVEELERIKTLVINRYTFGCETPSDRAGLYGYYQAVTGELTPALDYLSYINALTVHDLQAAAQRYLSSERYGVVTVRPDTP